MCTAFWLTVCKVNSNTNINVLLHNYAEWKENNRLERTLESLKTESSKFSMVMHADMFRRVNGEGLAYNQMFWTGDISANRPG